MMDPASIIVTIASGLKLVDQFYDLTKKLMGGKPGAHSVQVKQEGMSLVVEDHGHRQEVQASQIKLTQFDQRRHDTLRRKIDMSWAQYNTIDEELVISEAAERARLEQKRDRIKAQLCVDFRELVGLYERALGRGLPDHYSLHDICP